MLAWGVSPSLLKYFYAFSVSILIVHAQSWLEVHQMGKTWKVRPRAQEALGNGDREGNSETVTPAVSQRSQRGSI